MPTPRFATLLGEQVCHEFTASQQYVALAVWFDAHDLPQLATHFYRQAVEERNHAMMMVRYMLDRDLPVTVPGVGDVRIIEKGGVDYHELLSRVRELVDQCVGEH